MSEQPNQAPTKSQNTEQPIQAVKGFGFDLAGRLAGMATQVIIKANRDNDYGFDISPETRYSPYRGKNCADLEEDLVKLQCAKEKYTSKIGMKMHQNARKNKYRSLISDICKKNKLLACSKNALPDHDICNCDKNDMSIKNVIPYALSFYRELGAIIENATISKDDYLELVRKTVDAMKEVKISPFKKSENKTDTGTNAEEVDNPSTGEAGANAEGDKQEAGANAEGDKQEAGANAEGGPVKTIEGPLGPEE